MPAHVPQVQSQAYDLSRRAALRTLGQFSLFLGLCRLPGLTAAPVETVLGKGSIFTLSGHKAIITEFDALTFVENNYSKRFKFDSFQNPKLKELRRDFGLDGVVAPGTDEFDKQLHLMDWVHGRFKKFGQPSTNARGALEILKAIEGGHTFFCSQFAHVLISSASSLGWISRELALRRHRDLVPGRSSEHATTEIWSNQYRKWIMLDPTSNMYLEKNGLPLNAYEIRQEWFYNQGKDLIFVIGKQRKRLRKSDLPIFLRHIPGFGDLTVDPDELDKYGFIGYIPNTDLMDSREDYGQMFITKDNLCAGTEWHKRDLPPDPAADPYFPVGQASLSVYESVEGLKVELKTLTPNLERFEAKFGTNDWKECAPRFNWKLEIGRNNLQTRTLNQFGVHGPVSTVEVNLTN